MIGLAGTFEYEATFTKDSFSDADIVLQGSARSGENRTRLVGLSPKIRFWNERVVLVASEQHKAGNRNVSFPIGDAVNLVAQPDDELYLVRTGGGGIALSILRERKLILAIGAVSEVPLGEVVQMRFPPEDCESSFMPQPDKWLEFRVGSEKLKLQQREAGVIGDYHVYVERCWGYGLPGTDERVSVCVAGNPTIEIAAMRSAILMGHGDLKLVSWDGSEWFTPL